jgi:hypothetical protein
VVRTRSRFASSLAGHPGESVHRLE